MKKLFLLLLPIVLTMSQAMLVPETAFAQRSTTQIICERVPGADCETADNAAFEIIETIINLLFLIISAASVLVLIIAGFMYVASAGSPDTAKRAKNAIIFALVGIVIAFFARGIVMFILNSL